MVVRERILETALKMFRTYGVKGVTMFDIARDCGISKKTVYEHFQDKQALIDEGMQQLLTNHINYFHECLRTTDNAIEELVRNMKYITNMAKTMNPVMLHEIQKYHPDTWRSIESFKSDNVLCNIKKKFRKRNGGRPIPPEPSHRYCSTHAPAAAGGSFRPGTIPRRSI